MWLKNFKLAIIEKDIDAISALLNDIPQFEQRHEMQEAAYLCREAEAVVQERKAHDLAVKNQLLKHIDFLKSTQSKAPSELDLKS